eukprot:2974929-Rhodomonas_salina.3
MAHVLDELDLIKHNGKVLYLPLPYHTSLPYPPTPYRIPNPLPTEPSLRPAYCIRLCPIYHLHALRRGGALV